MTSPTESALQDVRVEWVASSFDADGIPRVPTDPEWHRFSDYQLRLPSWSGDAGTEGQPVAGSGDLFDHFRGAEEHDLTLEFYLQRHPVDSSGDPNGPIGYLITEDYQTAWPSHEIVARRDVDEGGAAGAGLREYVVGSGARPTSASLPGDPADSQPIPAEVGYAAERVRQVVISQPASSTTLTVSSTDAGDTVDVIIESEGGSTTETVTLPGSDPNEVDTTSQFDDIDVVYVDGAHAGDIQVSDGSNDLLAEPLVGTNTDGVESDRGVPPLGAGSHASPIGTDPEEYVFLGTSATFAGGPLAASPEAGDRLHALDLSIEVDVQREPQAGTRRQAIDIGQRTVSADADLAGPYESTAQNARYFAGTSADLVYQLPDGTITVKNATVTDTDDVDRQAGEAGLIYGATYEGHGDPAVTATHN